MSQQTRHLLNVVLMSARRLRRRPNIKTTLGKWLVFAGLSMNFIHLQMLIAVGNLHPISRRMTMT